MPGYIVFDADDHLKKVSEGVWLYLGYDDTASRPNEWDGIMLEDSETFQPSPGQSLDRRGYLKRSNGEILECEMSVSCLDGSGQLFLAEFELNENSRLGEPAVEKLDASSLNFLTTVSHELRVSLNGVIGFATLLSEGELQDSQRSILEKMQSCNALLKGLINDILEYSRVVSAKLDLNRETLDLEGFVEEVAGLFTDRATRKGLDLKVVIDTSARRQVELPKLRVAQVLSNLISNAIKFTGKGWVAVSVSIKGERIFFKIQDSGPGIPDTELDKVFRPFAQIQPEGSPSEGSGLGLSICKTLVEKMGGDLSLSQPVQGGSSFTFFIPLNEVSRSTAKSREVASGRRMEDPGQRDLVRPPKRILIVEDNKLNADILSHFLRDYGASFEVADNGRRAVEMYEDGKYDLLLMDVMLPEMNGYEATEKILENSTLDRKVPIIGVTAKVFRKDQARCLEAGMVDVVHKPVDFKVLRKVLDRHLYGVTVEAKPEDLAPRRVPSREEVKEDDRLDARILDSYIERMGSGLEKRNAVVDSAISILDGEVGNLFEALEAGNAEQISMRAHSLKGALSLLGARNILDLSKGLEAVASRRGEQLKTEHWKVLMQEAYIEFKSAVYQHLDKSVAI